MAEELDGKFTKIPGQHVGIAVFFGEGGMGGGSIVKDRRRASSLN